MVRTSHIEGEVLSGTSRAPQIRNDCRLDILSLESDHADYINTSNCFVKLTLAFVNLRPVNWANEGKHRHTMLPLVIRIFCAILFLTMEYVKTSVYTRDTTYYIHDTEV